MGRSAFLRRDWHVILVGWVGGNASFDHEQAQAALDPLTVSFTLDGAALETTRTPIKPFNDPEPFGIERAWYFQQGKVMAPDDLSVGQPEHDGADCRDEHRARHVRHPGPRMATMAHPHVIPAVMLVA